MKLLKQSTAFTYRAGPFLDSTDGVTEETGLTIAQADIRISKNGGAFAQTSASSPTTTHDSDGYYQLPLTTTDTNTLGPLRVNIHMAGAAPVWDDWLVVPANVYDALVAGSDTLEVDVTTWDGTAVATPDTAGYPVITIKDGTGQGELSLTSGRLDAMHAIQFTPMIPEVDPSGGLYRVGFYITDLFGDLPTTAEITPGTVSVARKVPGTSTYIGITTDSALTEDAGQVYLQRAYDPAVDGFASGDTLRFHFKSISVTIDSVSYELCDSTGMFFYKGIPEAGAMLLLNAEIDTVTSQTELILSAGPSENDILNGHYAVLTDNVDGTRKATALVSDWVGGTTTLHLDSAFAFTAAVGDRIQVIANPDVGLKDDAITSGKYDESTAFPLPGAVNVANSSIEANIKYINDSSAAAVRLALTSGQMIPFTVDNSVLTPTVTQFEADDITEATADHYNGRVILWTSGALAGQATSISDYELNGSNGRFTVVEMTEAPANNDTGIII